MMRLSYRFLCQWGPWLFLGSSLGFGLIVLLQGTPYLSLQIFHAYSLKYTLVFFGLMCGGSVFFLLLWEMVYRVKQDHFLYLLVSLKGTLMLRKFLRQKEKRREGQVLNPVLQAYNRAVGKSLVDVQEGRVIVWVQFPVQSQAQRLLKEQEAALQEELGSRYSAYVFSPAERKKQGLWVQGSKNS